MEESVNSLFFQHVVALAVVLTKSALPRLKGYPPNQTGKGKHFVHQKLTFYVETC